MPEETLKTLLQKLLSLGRECEWIEFKEGIPDPELIGKCLSALANSALICEQPHGYLVFGIHNGNLEIVGTKFSLSKKVGNEELENWLATQLSPRIDFKAFEFLYDDKPMVIIELEAAYDIPVSFKGVKYVRVGSYNKKLKDHPEKERKIWMQRDRTDFESGIAKKSIPAIDIFQWIDYPKYFDLMGLPMPIAQEGILQKLDEEGIINFSSGGGIDITNLGAALLAKEMRQFDRIGRKALRIIVYDGTGRSKTKKEWEATQGYAVGFKEFEQYIDGLLPQHEEIVGGLRKEIKFYPIIAIRELMANMLVHQDFTIRGTGPMIEIFDDRIEFTNPGEALVESLRFIDHSPMSRNEKITDMMRRMRICEERGIGIDNVIDAVEELHLPPPRFTVEEKFFRAILYGPKPWKEMTRQDKIMACYQHCCLMYVRNKPMGNQSLRERFNIPQANYPMISKIISDTLKEGRIKKFSNEQKSNKMIRYIPFWA